MLIDLLLTHVSSFRAMQRHLSSCDLDDSITASLKADIENLAREIRQLEQAWKQSLLTSAAACRYSDQSIACQSSVNCAGDERGTSEYHCDCTSQVVCEPSDNCASDRAGISDSDNDRTSAVVTDRSLGKAMESDRCDSVVHKTVKTNTCRHTCQELTTYDRAAKGDSSVLICDAHDIDADVCDCTSTMDDICREFVVSAKVDALFIDRQQLAQYKSCCNKLEELFSVFLSVTK